MFVFLLILSCSNERNGKYHSSLLGMVLMNLFYHSCAVINGILKPKILPFNLVLSLPILSCSFFLEWQSRSCLCSGSEITNGREPRSCLGRVFNSKLGCFATPKVHSMMHAATTKVENSAKGSSCKLKFVHAVL